MGNKIEFELTSGKKKRDSKAVSVIFVDEKNKNEAGISKKELNFFSAKPGEIFYSSENGKKPTILCGLGDPSKIDREVVRNAAASVTEYCNSKKITSIAVELSQVEGQYQEELALSAAEGLLLPNYAFTKYKSKDETSLLKSVFIATESKQVKTKLEKLSVLLQNIYLCRDLINSNADEVNPVAFADMAKKTGNKKSSALKVSILNKRAIEKNKMGLIEAVSRASHIEPRVVIMEYRGNPSDKKVFGLVGKGVTYDSGGLNLKPGDSMLTMKCDMSGAATAFATMKSLAELGVKRNVVAVIPLSENMLGGNSYKPGDVYVSHSGKTVEIGNSDAEGRLILADAISYLKTKYKPDFILDLATLTGACVVTFGETVAAYLSNSEEMSQTFETSAKTVGENVWRLPLFKDYDDRMDSEIADLSNISSEKNAGTITAAVFLRHFVGETPWLHLDIAGTAYLSKKRGCLPKFATGFGIMTLVEFIESLG